MGGERIALLFPGQGSQVVGMGKDLAERFPEARAVFQEADEALGFALSTLMWEGPADELTLTVNAQPALLTHSAAVWAVLRAADIDVVAAAGHSLGEFSAYHAAGSLGFADAVRTVRRRGELMLESGNARPGTMAAVLGLDDEVVEGVCHEASTEDSVVVPANFNTPGQVVVSGDVAAVERVGPMLVSAGAKKVQPLAVSGAFHSPLMRVAEAGLQAQLDAVAFADPAFAVVSNVSAQPVTDGAEARRLLVDQLTSTVRWTHSVRTMLQMGAERFLEVGAGKVLTGMLKRIDRAAEGRGVALGTAEQVEAFLNGAS
ncbi:MAG TPA: ACP S-malonyltransferase [Longimicrobium sp.]|jgi:[acyl-carrier-protein] S-malonyltransferase|uniref:ACP S-malonyltransferase n=1 Tax=Longimicrobium sp. TaxID=2029185 RepID=UPI002EDAD51C